MQFNYHNPYATTRLPVFARNIGVHLAPAGGTGRAAHAAKGRQRG
jgi:hypothetical protein